MVPELTKMGYDMILDRIGRLKVTMPDAMTSNEMMLWLGGYQECKNQIVDLVEKLKTENER